MKDRKTVRDRIMVTMLAMYRKAYDTLIVSQDFTQQQAIAYADNNFLHYHSALLQEGCAEIVGDSLVRVWLPGVQVPGNSMPIYSLTKEGDVRYFNQRGQWDIVNLHDHLYLHEYQVAPFINDEGRKIYKGFPIYYGGSINTVEFCTQC